MDNLPNGFTGFAGTGGRPDGFESAAEASRRSRGIAPNPKQAHSADAHKRGFNLERSYNAGADEAEIPFDQNLLDSVTPLDQRWAWTEIDLSAIRHNIAEARRFLHPRCRILAIVNADAYGHGAVEVSKAALSAGAERLGVATVSEGVQLRKAGITAPILLLDQPPASSIPLLLGYRITPSVYEASFAVSYGEMADMHGMRAPYHLAINTGMNRIGVHYERALEFLYQVNFHRALELEGVFT